MRAVRIRPDDRYVAEVVVLVTTLGAKRTEFNAGKRARDMLEIKRVHHKVIDFNRDCRSGMGSTGMQMEQVIERLTQEPTKSRRLQTECIDGDEDLCLPQIFIDGLYLGNAEQIQSLEDDGILDQILLRQICPARTEGIKTKEDCCGARRTAGDVHCRVCKSSFEELMVNLQTLEAAVDRIDKESALSSDYDDDSLSFSSDDQSYVGSR